MVLTVLGVVLLLLFLLLVPLGLPGLWLMLLVLGVATAYGEVGIWTFASLLALAAVAELGEFLAVKAMSERYGGSRGAFWGALVGGLLGVVVGLPVPVVGALVAGVLGTFAGAAAVALRETRRMGDAARVGWGAVVGRIVAVALKVGAGVVILAVGAGALLIR